MLLLLAGRLVGRQCYQAAGRSGDPLVAVLHHRWRHCCSLRTACRGLAGAQRVAGAVERALGIGAVGCRPGRSHEEAAGGTTCAAAAPPGSRAAGTEHMATMLAHALLEWPGMHMRADSSQHTPLGTHLTAAAVSTSPRSLRRLKSRRFPPCLYCNPSTGPVVSNLEAQCVIRTGTERVRSRWGGNVSQVKSREPVSWAGTRGPGPRN